MPEKLGVVVASWSNTKNVGSLSGKLRVTVTLVRQEGNGSVVDVTGTLINDNNSGTASGSNVPWNISGAVSKPSANFSFSVAAKRSFTIGTHRATIVHNADGTKTATVSLYVGQTPTSTFGTPGTVSVTFTLPRIPKPPSAPGAPTFSQITASSARAACTAPSNNGGASITGYRFQRSTVANMSSGVTNVDVSGAAATLGGLAADTTYYSRVYAKNSQGYGTVSAIRSFRTAPLAPNAVSGVTITRVSDSAQDLKWVNNPATGRPYTNVEIERRDTVNGTRVRIARLGGTATSYRDSTTVAGRRYDYYVRPTNAGGGGAWASAPSIGVNTTPHAPTNVAAVKDDAGIVVSWTPATPVQWGIVGYVVEDNPGGTGWVQVGTPGNVSSWVHTSPNASVTHQYRVKTVVYLYGASDAPRLTSAVSSASAIVQLLAPPLAPTILAPVGVHDRELPIIFRWKHNPVDTTKQAAYNLRYRIDGEAWIYFAGTTASSVTVPAPELTGSIDWQIQSRGEFPTYGPWSAVASFRLAAAPTVAIDSPAPGVLPVSTVSAVWGYYQVDGVSQTRAVAVLMDATTGDVLETRTVASASLTFFGYLLSNETAYSLTVTVTSADGLTATDTVTFTTDFPLPVTVEPIPVFDPVTGAVTVTFTDPPMPSTYEWTGPPNASPSTSVTAAGTVINLENNPRFATGADTPPDSTREPHPLLPAGSYTLVIPDAPSGFGYGSFAYDPFGE